MILVTGLMRSGTTPLAKMLHQMGVCMGTYQRFPSMNLLSDFEWEDVTLAESLANILSGKSDQDPSEAIDFYLDQRVTSEQGTVWGVKTPFVLPFISEFKEQCEKHGEPLSIILTDRPYDEVMRSVSSQLSHLEEKEFSISHAFCNKVQDLAIKKWLEASEDAHVFHLKETHNNPEVVASRLAEIADIEIRDITSVTRGIWKEASHEY